MIADLLGFSSPPRFNAYLPPEGGQSDSYTWCLMQAMRNFHAAPSPRFRSINPKQPMTDKAVRLFQASSLLRAA